jgi:glycosyltransferase involved in cell wall biosynthesis
MNSINNLPKITVIIAIYNGAKTLQRCLDSITAQTYDRTEIIIIDGASNDGSIEIIKANQQQIDYWESEKDRGIYHAFNKGILNATGDWIIFLGCDDYFWETTCLTKVAAELSQIDKLTKIAYGRVNLVSLENKILQTKSEPWSKCRQAYLHYDGGDIDHQGVFQHHSLFQESGLYDESFKICGDYELLLRELKLNEPYFLENIIISARQIGGTSLQPNNGLKTFRECQKARSKHGLNNLRFLPQRLYIYWLQLTRKILLGTIGTKYLNIITDFYRKLTFRPAIWTK